MRSRRKAREGALRVLYEIEVGGNEVEESAERMILETNLEPEVASYSKRLITGILEHRANLDQNIAGYVRDYDYSRLAAIDRNILRIGAYELLFEPDMPPAVSINEAIELAKEYSTAESGKFVNGVLARLLKDSAKANWVPPPQVELEVVEPKPPSESIIETIHAESEEAKLAQRFGNWTLRDDKS